MPGKQAYALNPYLPDGVCIADGEPHVFDGRVYLFGSHDRATGKTFCELDYEFWSAPVDNLSDWSCPGIAYSASQDPDYCEETPYLFAPDVTRGNDGRYYLYYMLAGERGRHGYRGTIRVVSSDTPDGRYSYIGYVRNPDGTLFHDCVLFDPAVMNDGGIIRLCFGTSYFLDEWTLPPANIIARFVESKIFERPFSAMCMDGGPSTGAFEVTLADDMLTVNSAPARVAPTKTRGTSWEGHAFFEGASLRKFDGLYYFVYSSRNNHELCYATSRYPDRDFEYRGVLISNGDIGFEGLPARSRVMLTGNNHGSIERIGEKHFVFYHRMAERSTYSRQPCAEPIRLSSDGSIPQTRMTSCGLEDRPLPAVGSYPAGCACILTNGAMPHLVNGMTKRDIPFVSFSRTDSGYVSLLAGLRNGVVVGFRSFSFEPDSRVWVELQGDFEGVVRVAKSQGASCLCLIEVQASRTSREFLSQPTGLSGTSDIYLEFCGRGTCTMRRIGFCKAQAEKRL